MFFFQTQIYARLPLFMRKALYPIELKIRAIWQRRLNKIVKVAMTQVLQAVATRAPSIQKHFFYGASAINSKHLVTWYVFQTESDLETARRNGLINDLDALSRAELLSCGYPKKGVPLMHVAFTSEEDVQSKSAGNYWAYFK